MPTVVSSFIFTNYAQPEQQRSLLQVSRSLSALPLNTTNVSRDAYVSAYRSITRSAECLSLILTDHTQAFQTLSELQFSQQAELQQFLAMNEAFSGQPLRMTPPSSLGSTCQFNLSASTRRRLQATTNTSNCSSSATNVLVYFNGIGYSPSAAIDNVAKMQ